ncbi:Protein zyg-11-like B [Acipenser ruthenus]|uniref:Protein zyg-11-like B n=1 Tax=Acipenser ruthenus TaxID=7906 RepID=A0A662YTF5_ACIRT|nr:Protein zyg-11-like B [Acipenser ruthenus]
MCVTSPRVSRQTSDLSTSPLLESVVRYQTSRPHLSSSQSSGIRPLDLTSPRVSRQGSDLSTSPLLESVVRHQTSRPHLSSSQSSDIRPLGLTSPRVSRQTSDLSASPLLESVVRHQTSRPHLSSSQSSDIRPLGLTSPRVSRQTSDLSASPLLESVVRHQTSRPHLSSSQSSDIRPLGLTSPRVSRQTSDLSASPLLESVVRHQTSRPHLSSSQSSDIRPLGLTSPRVSRQTSDLSASPLLESVVRHQTSRPHLSSSQSSDIRPLDLTSPRVSRQEEASPASLTDLCLSFLSSNLDQFCWERPDGSLSLRETVVFPQELADQLLRKMATEGMLNDSTVGIFRSCQYLRLRRACICKARISAEAFHKAFCQHRLLELDASGVNADVAITDIIQGLSSNKWNQESLQRLVLNGLTLSLEDPYERCFSRLAGLRALAIANVDFYTEDLSEVCSLPRLESLDISNTCVTDLAPLLSCRERLRSLTMHHLKCLKMSTSQLLDVLSQLAGLQHLDISDDKQFTSDIAGHLLEQPGILPQLCSLDVSGRKQVTDKAVKAFVQQRPGMHFIGLLATGAGFCDFLSGEGSLKVSGEANEAQICEALRRYSERAFFVREALFHLFSLTHVMEKVPPDILKLVVTGMKTHPLNLHVQLAASACVFNLTKQDLAVGMPVRLLGQVTHLLLEAMKNFPNHQQVPTPLQGSPHSQSPLSPAGTYSAELPTLPVPTLTAGTYSAELSTLPVPTLTAGTYSAELSTLPVPTLTSRYLLLCRAPHTPSPHCYQQLQKNCLLSLCSDRILQEVPFNRFEAAKLVMQWLCNYEDQNMQRMAVAIISILAAKLSTEQTAQLGAELFIVRQLLHIVKQKTSQSLVDTTLKFTLSALWNLTDESPTTCRHFIENQGLELFMKVLESFPSESSIQQKVLGLLNNIAEVKELHAELMWKSFVEHISVLLHSSEVEVSYFAAGIIAHLMSRGEEAWTLSTSLRTSLLQQLHSTILKWPTPECEMVAYRSFNPFFPLLKCFSTPGVQLWAAWAVQHVCSKNASRYCSMLIEEGGMQHLYQVKENPQTHPDVQRVSSSILESLERHLARTGQTVPPYRPGCA